MTQKTDITMENYRMAAESAGGVALLKIYGIKAILGMAGAAMLYVVLPPTRPDGSFDKREFVARLAVAGVFSVMFGDMTADALNHFAPWLQPHKHKSAVDLMCGAPGWWISRAIALFFQNRRGSDIAQIAKDLENFR